MTFNEVKRSSELTVEEQERRIAAANQNSAVARVVRIIYFIFGALELLLLGRVVLRALGANPNNGFASFVYAFSEPFVALFNGLFGNPAIGDGVIELTIILGMFVYAILAWLIGRLVWLVLSRPR